MPYKLIFNYEGTLTGTNVTRFDFEHKADALKQIAAHEGISLKQVAFVGDNGNDVEAARTAGLAIAFNSKCEELNAVSKVVIKKKDLRAVLKELV
ncbi:hypothetical protein COT48_03630 [Candidatus Woesearchaeota archaeon CG08_land_8_20_14_0_20_47_9]|nr:MAG: hypothetical protein AUJ69_03815 [Candidatus Woesearchaeota archaeon CG1_02_47_18]PIO03750.1 MAG: hypothetical protein COT48_03630 [Candidatus Woesearchaeota archaeon CG08_land_8_20_14_0_20_47_9]HII30093.1 HAD hydrolase family protein [Candidatus Woesearchaeota archaeon]